MDTVKSRPRESTLASEFNSEVELPLYLGLMRAMLLDIANVICTYTEVERARDYLEIENRTHSEGISFLTKTLPSLAKAVDVALATDTRLMVKGFKTIPGSRLPRFLAEIFSLVFTSDGIERSDASEVAVLSIRQIGFAFYKLELPFSEKSINEVIERFKHNETNLWSSNTLDQSSCRALWIQRRARDLIHKVLAPVDPLGPDFWPKHGPGAVATGEKGSQKMKFKRFYSCIAAVIPYETYFFYNLSHFCDDLQEYLSLEELNHGTAKVVLVPKDSRGPRLISCEPLEFQWCQQGLMAVLVDTLENHPLTRGLVNFRNQEINRNLALKASSNSLMATLDMKDASDMVSCDHVRELFPPNWVRVLMATRSSFTKLPSGEILPLNKFAPMGSAVCFPVEAFIFWAISTASIEYSRQMELSVYPYKIHLPPSRVYVYGDDIICDTADYGIVEQALTTFGLVVNRSKCCTGAHFRESCGMDAFKGIDVTPLKFKARWSRHLTNTDYISWVAYANRLNEMSFFNACDYLQDQIQKVRRTPYSEKSEDGVIAFVDCRKMAIMENRKIGVRFRKNPDLQYLEIETMVVTVRSHRANVPGWSEMLRIASVKDSPFTPEGERKDASVSRLQSLVRLAPYLEGEFPDRIETRSWIKPPGRATAYQYTLPRQVALRRGWSRM